MVGNPSSFTEKQHAQLKSFEGKALTLEEWRAGGWGDAFKADAAKVELSETAGDRSETRLAR